MLRVAAPITAIALVLSFPAHAQDQHGGRKAATQRAGSDSYLFSDSLHAIRFFVSSHMHMRDGVICQVDLVELSEKTSGKILQQLELVGATTPCPKQDGPFVSVEVADFNFDRQRDFRIMKAGSEPNHPAHNYWLFDPVLNGFAPSTALDSVQDPQFSYEMKLVSSQWYESAIHRGSSTFRYENGRLTMVSNMEKFKDGDHERWVIWGMKDGRFQPVNERIEALPKR